MANAVTTSTSAISRRGLARGSAQNWTVMRYTPSVRSPTPTLPSPVPHQGGGPAWWGWLLLALGVTTAVAGSLLIRLPAWLSTGVARLNPGRSPAVRKRLKDGRLLAQFYAGLATAGLVVLVVWVLPPYLTRHPAVRTPADRYKAITDTRTGLIAALAALGAAGGLAFTARTYRLSRVRTRHRPLQQGHRAVRQRQDRDPARRHLRPRTAYAGLPPRPAHHHRSPRRLRPPDHISFPVPGRPHP